MFMNDDEFILYIMGTMIPNRPTSFSMLMDVRGLTRLSDSQGQPLANLVLGYEQDQYGPESIDWQPGFIPKGSPRWSHYQLPVKISGFISAAFMDKIGDR